MRHTLAWIAAGLLATATSASAQTTTGNPEGARDPIQPTTNNKYASGKIVRVDPGRNRIVIRTGPADDPRDEEYEVDTTTKFWGGDKKELADGIRFAGLKKDTPVWLRLDNPNRNRMLAEVWLSNPGVVVEDTPGRGNGGLRRPPAGQGGQIPPPPR